MTTIYPSELLKKAINGNLIKREENTINDLRLLKFYDVYTNFLGRELSTDEKEVLQKAGDFMGLLSYHLSVSEIEDIVNFKNYKRSYNFYSVVVKELAEVEKEILGKAS